MKRSPKSVSDGREHGFTLIELLVIVLIIGVLAAIVLFALSSPAQQSVRSVCRSDARAVEVAQEARRTQLGSYANDVSGLVPHYLRTTPGNATHYLITTDSTGTVYVIQMPAGAPVASTTNPSPCDAVV